MKLLITLVIISILGFIHSLDVYASEFNDALKKDCEQTIRQILTRPGASWNSEWGWAPEERCQQFWPLTQAEYTELFARQYPDYELPEANK